LQPGGGLIILRQASHWSHRCNASNNWPAFSRPERRGAAGAGAGAGPDTELPSLDESLSDTSRSTSNL